MTGHRRNRLPAMVAAAGVAVLLIAAPAQADDANDKAFEQNGEASHYGRGFHGKKTASGERFNQHDLTAAHRTLPMGTEVTVTNQENGKQIEVEINDRGPYAKGRIIDLSTEAAKQLGIDDGVARVKVEATEEAIQSAKDDDEDDKAKPR